MNNKTNFFRASGISTTILGVKDRNHDLFKDGELVRGSFVTITPPFAGDFTPICLFKLSGTNHVLWADGAKLTDDEGAALDITNEHHVVAIIEFSEELRAEKLRAEKEEAEMYYTRQYDEDKYIVGTAAYEAEQARIAKEKEDRLLHLQVATNGSARVLDGEGNVVEKFAAKDRSKAVETVAAANGLLAAHDAADLLIETQAKKEAKKTKSRN